MSSSVLRNLLLVAYFCIYLTLGFQTESRFIERMPLPEHWMEDFGFYQRAMNNALIGRDPYGVRSIGVSYLYPPPALLVIELFGHIQPLEVMGSAFAGTNLLLLLLMISGIVRFYKFSFTQTWWWYLLGLGFAPFLELIHIGQINIITMFGLFLMFYWESASPWLGGFGLGLAVITKVSPLLFFGSLFANRNFKVAAFAIAVILLLTGLSVLRYGSKPLLDYPDVFGWLLDQQQLDTNSQSLTAKLAIAEERDFEKFISRLPGGLQRAVRWPFAVTTIHTRTVQRILTGYILILILLSCALTFFGRQPKEPTFIVTLMGMMLSPNIVWYHHYVFFLLPIFIWMGWRQFKPAVVLWCLLGLLVIQYDRFFPPYGLIVHTFGHLSLLAVLAWQARNFLSGKQILAVRLKTISAE